MAPVIDPKGDRWLAFYLGHDFDHRGRTIERMWAYSDRSLEAIHDYIQWLFPLRTPSPFNPDAPLLNDDNVAFARSSPEVQRRLRTSLQRMLYFYGFDLYYGDEWRPEIIVNDERFDECTERWLNPGNHNYQRISRMLGCLVAVGLEAEARALLGALEELYEVEDERDEGNRIGARTLGFWRAAAGAPSPPEA